VYNVIKQINKSLYNNYINVPNFIMSIKDNNLIICTLPYIIPTILDIVQKSGC